MFWFSLVMIFLAITGGFLMLWRIPLVNHPSEIASAEPHLTPSDLIVIIPAYNEAERISPLLRSLLEQEGVDRACFVVVDDHSSDQTAQIASDMGFRVIVSDPRRPGWIGKSRACWSGARSAVCRYLMFLDADTRLEGPDSLRQLVTAYQSAGDSGIVSVQPWHEIHRAYENLSALFNIIVMAGISTFTPWGRKIRGAGAFGPCLICRQDQYMQAGGHERVRGFVMDDLALSEAFAAHGLPTVCLGGRRVIRFRMYPEGIRSLVEGWTKNFGTAAGSTHPLVFTLIIAWISGGFSTTALLVRSILIGPPWQFAAAMALCLVYYGQLLWHSRRTGSFHPMALILYPLHSLFFTGLFMWSLYLTKIKRRVSWRGRSIDV